MATRDYAVALSRQESYTLSHYTHFALKRTV